MMIDIGAAKRAEARRKSAWSTPSLSHCSREGAGHRSLIYADQSSAALDRYPVAPSSDRRLTHTTGRHRASACIVSLML